MQVRVLRTFMNKKYGTGSPPVVRGGLVLTVPQAQYDAWRKTKPPLAEEYQGPIEAEAPGPSENKSIPAAPSNKAKPKKTPAGEVGKGKPPSDNATPAVSASAGRRGGGKAKPSSAAPAGPA